MPYIDGTEMSCGVDQLHNLSSSPKENLLSVGKSLYYYDERAAFITWSDVWGKNRRGNKLYRYVKRNFPKSKVIKTTTATNPNTKNKIVVFVWKIPRNFKKWWKENR